MFGLIGKIFGSDKAVDSVIGEKGLIAKAGAWYGNKEFTVEEQAENGLAQRQLTIEHLKAMHPFKLAQRALAFAVAFVWVLIIINYLVAVWIWVGTAEYSVVEGVRILINGIDARPSIIEFAQSKFVWMPTSAVFALYFLGGVIPGRKE